jgi:hypothetical protein
MTKLPILSLALLLICSPSTITGQNQRPAKRATVSPVRLLPGYKIRWASGIDTWSGTIWKENGLKISFSQGGVGIETDQVDKNEIAWREEQVVNGQQVVIVYMKSGHLLVDIPKLIVGFDATTTSQQDIAEVLLMALTWDTAHGYPAEPGAIETPPKAPK